MPNMMGHDGNNFVKRDFIIWSHMQKIVLIFRCPRIAAEDALSLIADFLLGEHDVKWILDHIKLTSKYMYIILLGWTQ